MVRILPGLLTFLTVLSVLGLTPAMAESDERIIQWSDTNPKTNGGRTYYVVIRSTTDTEFLTDDYESISEFVASKQKDKSILKTVLVWPGRTKEIRFKANGEQTIGVYLLITNPKGDWKALIPSPLYHHYALTVSAIPGGDPDGDESAPPLMLSVSKMLYPQRMVDRPLTLFSGMLEAQLGLRANLTAEDGHGFIAARYGLMNTTEIGLTYAAVKYAESGLIVGKTLTPKIRTWLTKNLGLDFALPIGFEQFALAGTLGLPYRARLGDNTVLQLFDRIYSFRFYSRVPDEKWAEEIETSTGIFRLNARLEQQVSNAFSLVLETGPQAEVYRLASTQLPFQLNAIYSHKAGIDVGLNAGVIDALVDRGEFFFGLTAAARFGGN